MQRGAFSPGIDDDKVRTALQHDAEGLLAFAQLQLQKKQIRKDYREFLELITMFLGGTSKEGNRFRALGPIHHARWMAKAIYSIKIFLFRDQFHLTPRELSGLRDLCIFIVLRYQKAWFTATDPIAAPRNDLKLLKELAASARGDGSISNVSKAVLGKFTTHLWYLSEKLMTLAFFDDDVSAECKRKMCKALQSHSALNDHYRQKKTEIENLQLINQISLDSLVNSRTLKFFEILKMDIDFLRSDPTRWHDREDFKEALNIVRSLHVTNDIAERAVALISEYNDLLTRDESSKQQALSVVQKFRELSSDHTKENLKFSLENYLNNQIKFSNRTH